MTQAQGYYFLLKQYNQTISLVKNKYEMKQVYNDYKDIIDNIRNHTHNTAIHTYIVAKMATIAYYYYQFIK